MREAHLVVGPPCAGKTTWVTERAQPGDLIVDWDQLAIEAGSTRSHDHDAPYRTAATARRTELEHQVATMTTGRAYVIRTLPREPDRTATAYRFAATIHVIDPGIQTCLTRARLNQRHPDVDAAILRWYGIQWGARCYEPAAVLRGTNPRRTREWRVVRAIVLRGNPPCAICGLPMRYGVPYNRAHPDPLYPTVDHIVPISQGGAWYDPQNCRPAHWKCNTDHVAEPGRTPAASIERRISEAW